MQEWHAGFIGPDGWAVVALLPGVLVLGFDGRRLRVRAKAGSARA